MPICRNLPKKQVMEYHIHIVLEGKTIQIDGLPEQAGKVELSETCRKGLQMIFSLIESRERGVECVCVGGICFMMDRPVIAAFDIWVQLENDGYFLPMGVAAKLFSENGIPYYHSPYLS